MNKIVILIAAGASAAVAVPASAGQCPSGQIFRVSKGVCVARAAAIKDGILLSGAGKRGGETAKKRSSQAEARPVRVAAKATADDNPQFIPPAVAPSPYGALRLHYFQTR